MQIISPDTQLAHIAAEAAWKVMERLERMMSRYVPGNALDDLHAAAGKRAVTVPPELFAVLQRAQALAITSNGAFDVTIGSLRDWDFRPGYHHVPTDATIRQQLLLVRSDALVLDPVMQTARLRQAGTRLDLGGVAKLPILQAGMATLRAHGVRSAMIDGGGDVLVCGGNEGAPWRIGLRDPRQPTRLIGTVALYDGVVASSGDYERCIRQDGKHYHHILNPHTGYPAIGPHGAVFISADTTAINGWGAATLVAGRRFAQQQLSQHSTIHSLVVERDHSIWMSAGMRQLLKGSAYPDKT